MQQVVNGGTSTGAFALPLAAQCSGVSSLDTNLLFGYHSCRQYFSGALASSAFPCGSVGRRFTSLERYTRGV
jgi:hypothetical protein